ncbi:PREDICTED: zinc finger protein PLAGL1 [Myotis davidii]|uniref:Zinc finger protein PLAGL1 n=1 Tax=Myotis davidii TaxID=225400 RepID=L5MFJ0_MYODS|nr:PREDICTED: zinc finger protein PLAGL1 [Myotis davidii]XP_006755460.1 PREDICTED: zinc finger protein PLAGL1 [Myotis davidii]XP_015413998.1 PREDICTED: zinc finger protein PLAGL1 [Myotis davidii]XP_015413999.1 PREDICTED: zinc finger protein PLAGL1 [Myotis davidii]XP_015414000.1 PREDICTED: zinc finger protein PLAGL1 [Myotis davidii]XP_015414001.1 PREDICTED: zinc finger protein PLAGL1 [Myotis davidii]XP_015414002.1 PREDICTED: zinc finger protein PLAGL1 [Myotis davidii]XP_015414003.1 PREDICTED:
MAAYLCQVCGQTFLTLEKFTIHSFTHSKERPFKCLHPECGKAFVSRYKLMRHMATHSPQKSHQCGQCEKTFNRKDHLKNHLQTHDPNKVSFVCEQCGKKYHTMLGYKRHLALHKANSGDLTCGVCALVLRSTEVLLIHLKSHADDKPHGNKQKKHRCDHCERLFYTRKDVRRHMVVHTGCKDFLCQFCAQRFGRKDHLTRHTKKTHLQELMKESLQAGDFLNAFHSLSPQFQLKAAALAPYALGASVQNGLASGLPPEVHTLNPIEPPCQPVPPLPEPLIPLPPMAPPSSPPQPLQNHKYTTATSYPPLANLPLKTDTKGFCNFNLLEELPLQEPPSPHRLNPGFDLGKGGAGKVNLPRELPIDAVNITIPASLEIPPLLGFWQLPPPPTQNAFGNSTLALGPGEPLPHRLSCLGQQQQEPPLAMSAMSLGQLHLPPLPHVFPAGTGTAILPHFHHAFR